MNVKDHEITCKCVPCIIELFRVRVGNFGKTPAEAAGQCFNVNDRFCKFAKIWRDDPRIIELSKQRFPHPPTSAHYVTWFETDRVAVDWTHRQFFAQSPHPLLCDEEILRQWWGDINWTFVPANERERAEVVQIVELLK